METLGKVSPLDKDKHVVVTPTRTYIYTNSCTFFSIKRSVSLSLLLLLRNILPFPLSFSMERANVSSTLYEGRGSKRSLGGEVEEGNSSKSARTSAKERPNGFKARNGLSNISNNRTMMTRSMSMKTMEKKDEKLVAVEVILLDEEDENVNGDTNNKAVEGEQPQQQPAVNEVVEKKGEDEVAMLTLDDWPLPWCSEEAFSWCNGYVCGWYSYWDVMSGDHWLPRADSVEAAWRDDLWISENNNESPKP